MMRTDSRATARNRNRMSPFAGALGLCGYAKIFLITLSTLFSCAAPTPEDLYLANSDAPPLVVDAPSEEIDEILSEFGGSVSFLESNGLLQSDLELYDAKGKLRKLITNNPAQEMNPTVSPDQRRIAYRLYHEIHVVDIVSGESKVVTDSDTIHVLDVAWNPKLATIAFKGESPESRGDIDDESDIYFLDLEDGSIEQITDDFALEYGNPLWHPTGTKLAYFTYGNKSNAIRLYDVVSNATETIIDDWPDGMRPSDMAWTPDGQNLLLLTTQSDASAYDREHAIQLLDMKTGILRTIASGLQRGLELSAESRNGEYLLSEGTGLPKDIASTDASIKFRSIPGYKFAEWYGNTGAYIATRSRFPMKDPDTGERVSHQLIVFSPDGSVSIGVDSLGDKPPVMKEVPVGENGKMELRTMSDEEIKIRMKEAFGDQY